VSDERVLVVNAGSTSLKLSVVAHDGSVETIDSIADTPVDVLGVAHRVVHGGSRFREPVIIDDAVESELHALAELAPLHNRRALAAIGDARRALPAMRHVAVFDTAFHATIPDEASTFAVPQRWREEWGIRRFGFHGLSVQWAAKNVPVGRLVVCHLGGGCSVTAVQSGRSVDTTMGYSPLDGVPMATRSGSIDPEIALHLLRAGLLELEELEHALENDSGLRGLSGGRSARYEELQAAGDAASRLALAVFAHRVAGAVAAMTASLGGLDALVFTAGVGENSPQARADVCGRLRFLGVELDTARNESARPDVEIGLDGSAVRVVVLRAREDVVAARAARALLL
jgi:acetate kinase